MTRGRLGLLVNAADSGTRLGFSTQSGQNILPLALPIYSSFPEDYYIIQELIVVVALTKKIFSLNYLLIHKYQIQSSDHKTQFSMTGIIVKSTIIRCRNNQFPIQDGPLNQN